MFIYSIENKKNGRCYVSSASDPKAAWERHKRIATAGNSDLHWEMRVYGLEHFHFEVREEVNERVAVCESKWMVVLDSHVNGYNTRTRRRLMGKVHTAAQEVDVYDLSGNYIARFGSQGEAAYELGIYSTQVSQCLSGKHKSAGGFVFAYPGKEPVIPEGKTSTGEIYVVCPNQELRVYRNGKDAAQDISPGTTRHIWNSVCSPPHHKLSFSGHYCFRNREEIVGFTPAKRGRKKK